MSAIISGTARPRCTMAGFHAARPMEDFFIHPTFLEHPPPNPSTMVDDNQLYATAAAHHRDVYTLGSKGKSPLKPTASIVDLVNEPVFWPGYTSEEEVASPVDGDDDDDDDGSSIQSNESLGSIVSTVSLPEQLAESVNVKQQCNRAQAVKIQVAGKARVVSLPKPIDIPARRSTMGPATPVTPSTRPSLPVLDSTAALESTRSSEDSRNTRNDSICSSSFNSPASTAPSSVDEPMERRPPIKHQRSFSRHVPLMEAAKALSPTSPTSGSNSPMYPQFAGLPNRQSTAWSDRSDTTSITTTRSSVRRITNFSSRLSLNKIGKNLVGRESMYGGELESVKEPEPSYIAPAVTAPRQRIPVRSTSLKPKMVARAANERAAPITLPPLPKEANKASYDWPLRRKDSGASRPRSMSTRLTHVAQMS